MKDLEKDLRDEIAKLKAMLKKSQASNHYLSSQLAELKDLRAGQEQFMDALENIIADHGFKLVEIAQ